MRQALQQKRSEAPCRAHRHAQDSLSCGSIQQRLLCLKTQSRQKALPYTRACQRGHVRGALHPILRES